MATTPPSQPTHETGGIHIGDVGGSVNFSALGDIVGGNKITTITTTIQISVEAVTQRPLITASPYRGLDRFEDRDKDLFFGRDQLIKSLLAQLSASNVLLVLGASGSGKSSVVRAGLLPQLAQLIGARFRYFTFVPDVNPFESLRAALLAAGFSQTQTRELADARPETATQLIHTLQRNGDQWLFFVDQFEEIFTVGDEKLRASFIAALVAIAQDPSSSTKLVLAMRADFLDRFSPFPQFAKIIEKNIDFVADMHADELRQAIEQPAARHGVVFEQGLVEEIIKDVQGQAGSLPLLQYTLDLLWQEEAREDGLADRHLNTKAYLDLGGVRGALQKRADEIYASFGDGSDAKAATPKQEIVRQIFLRLVDLAGEGSNDAAWRPVRRRASMTMFTAAQEQEILQALINQKLLVSNREGDDATVEVAHEALFTSWGRLKNWIEAGKQVIFARNRLADDARRWQRRQQEGDSGAEEELLGGSRLAQALDMRARGDFVTVVGGLGETETQFLDASAALRDRRRQEEQERQQRELAQAQALAAEQKQRAEEQKKVARRTRLGLIVASLLAALALAAAIYGLGKAKEADTQARVAQEQTKVAQQQTQIATEQGAKTEVARREAEVALARSYFHQAVARLEGEKPFEALAYAARAVGLNPGNDAARTMTLELLLWRPWPRFTVHVESEAPVLGLSADGRLLLVASGVNALLYDVESGSLRGQPLRHPSPITAVAITADGKMAATGDAKGQVRLWTLESGKSDRSWTLGRINALAFTRDGRRLAAAAEDGAQVWDSVTGLPLGPRLLRSSVASVEFGHNGTRVVTIEGPKEGRVQVWDYQRGVGNPVDPDGQYESACLDETGRSLMVTAYEGDSFARVWDVKTGKPISPPLVHKDSPIRGRFLRDGHQLLTISRDGSARVWDLPKGGALPTAEFTHEGTLSTAAISDDGSWVATGASNGVVHVWDRRTGVRKPLTLPSKGQITAGALSANGKFAVSLSGSQVWIAQSSTGTAHQIQLKMDAEHVAISNDGSHLAYTTPSGSTFVFETSGSAPALQTEYRSRTGPILSDMPSFGLYYGDVGGFLVHSYDKYADVIDVQNGRLVGKQLSHDDIIRSANFSHDGERLVTSSRDGTVRVWNVRTGDPIVPPLSHREATVAAVFTANSERVMSASRNALIWSWESASRQALPPVPLHGPGLIGSASFSRDGTRVATTEYSTTARVWDTGTGLPLTPPLRAGSAVVNLSFSDDGTRLLTVGGEVSVWDLPMATKEEAPVLSKWGEAVAGLRVADSAGLGAIDSPDAKMNALRGEAQTNSGTLPVWRMVRWFFADPAKRTISPLSEVSVEKTNN